MAPNTIIILRSTPDGLVKVETSKGPILAERVVVATNGWTAGLVPKLRDHLRAVTNTVLCSTKPLPDQLRWGRFVSSTSGGEGAQEVYMNIRLVGHYKYSVLVQKWAL